MNNTKNKNTILSPVITYKSTVLSANKCYTFLVDRLANKHQIAEAFEAIYGAKAKKVNTTAVRTKKRRTRAGYVQKSDQKKAYIYSDKELDIFPKV